MIWYMQQCTSVNRFKDWANLLKLSDAHLKQQKNGCSCSLQPARPTRPTVETWPEESLGQLSQRQGGQMLRMLRAQRLRIAVVPKPKSAWSKIFKAFGAKIQVVINLVPFGDVLHNPFMVIWGMVYNWFYHISHTEAAWRCINQLCNTFYCFNPGPGMISPEGKAFLAMQHSQTKSSDLMWSVVLHYWSND